MTHTDRERWDDKWATTSALNLEASSLLTRHAAALTGGEALDLACGLGQNALWLAAQGYQVTALDISPVALARASGEAAARGLSTSVTFVEADLDSYELPKAAFDVVTVFRFLDRDLFPAIAASLRSGGWLFYQTYNVRRLETRPEKEPSFLLEPGELEQAFAGLELVESVEEGDLSHVVCRQR